MLPYEYFTIVSHVLIIQPKLKQSEALKLGEHSKPREKHTVTVLSAYKKNWRILRRSRFHKVVQLMTGESCRWFTAFQSFQHHSLTTIIIFFNKPFLKIRQWNLFHSSQAAPAISKTAVTPKHAKSIGKNSIPSGSNKFLRCSLSSFTAPL